MPHRIDVGGLAASASVMLVPGALTYSDCFVRLDTADGGKTANQAFHGVPARA